MFTLNDMSSTLIRNASGTLQVLHDTGTIIADDDDYNENYDSVRVGQVESNMKAIIWGWEEDIDVVGRHDASSILTSTTNIIKYPPDLSDMLECGYQTRKTMKLKVPGAKVRNTNTGSRYSIDFRAMEQTNLKTNYVRDIHRRVHFMDCPSGVADVQLPDPPSWLGDPQEGFLATFKGQVIQLSKITKDNRWVYGTVVFDPRHKGKSFGIGSLPCIRRNSPTSGWFPCCLGKTDTVKVLRNVVSSTGTCCKTPPGCWEAGKDGLVKVSKRTQEYDLIVESFLSSMGKMFEKDQVSVRKLQRVQSESQWQQYALKIGTMKEHYSKNPDNLVNNNDVNGLEKRWLFHGTAATAVPKIVKHGFNRSFAGKNGVKFGSGVYFAANAHCAYGYASPDAKGHHHMFLCRVAVGDWCKGSSGQKVPDSKQWSQDDLFDSTVDNVNNPSIFVAYHDAQAYPEYLVSFQLKQ